MNNAFTNLLTLLNVKHTKRYSSRLYNEHPHKYSLYGLSKMLSEYNIENIGVKFENKEEDILKLEAPFIAYVGSDFGVVSKITSDKVHYIWQEEEVELTVNEFSNLWNGVALLAESNEQSIEPYYIKNCRYEQLNIFRKLILFSSISTLLILTFVSNQIYTNVGIILLCILNLTGLYISYLLVLKQMHIHSNYVDRICSLFSQKGCNNVLESDAAKIAGIIGWSEIGLAYFITNTIITFFLPDYITYLVFINIATLPYTIWSVWYQKFRAKQWCPLCLIIQIILWGLFIVNLSFGLIYMPQFSMMDFLLIISLYIIPILIINIVIIKISRTNKMEQITQELNSIKSSEEVFSVILKQQPYYEVSLNTSNILLGNPNSNILITILTNPHCNPCAKMHARIENLLENSDHLCIQYIFSSFNPDLDTSNKFLLAVYFYSNEREKIYSQWFKKGKLTKENFFKAYNMNIDDKLVLSEFNKHRIWKDQVGILATPTILVNGYKLPDNYKIEDLKYIMSIK